VNVCLISSNLNLGYQQGDGNAFAFALLDRKIALHGPLETGVAKGNQTSLPSYCCRSTSMS
jgi:hypothetical protein